jgi:hypothetical protein
VKGPTETKDYAIKDTQYHLLNTIARSLIHQRIKLSHKDTTKREPLKVSPYQPNPAKLGEVFTCKLLIDYYSVAFAFILWYIHLKGASFLWFLFFLSKPIIPRKEAFLL